MITIITIMTNNHLLVEPPSHFSFVLATSHQGPTNTNTGTLLKSILHIFFLADVIFTLDRLIISLNSLFNDFSFRQTTQGKIELDQLFLG